MKIPIEILPPLPFVAKDMGDYFVPEQCKNKCLGRRGRIKKTTGEVLDGAMIAYKDDELHLVFLTLDNGKWIINTQFGKDAVIDKAIKSLNLY